MADDQNDQGTPEPVKQNGKPEKSLWVQYGEYSHLALVLPVGVGIGWFFGSWIDGKMNTHWIQWVGLLFGLVSGFWELIRATKKLNREN
jgi:F0F1-type ATP synthase assembly protein I